MLIRHVGVVSESDSVSLPELTRAAAAVQKQVARDFGPLWNVNATVAAFAVLEDVPTDYWSIIIKDDIQKSGAGGVHEDENGQPFALVEVTDTWSLALSHECLEMLGDPFGNRLVAGQSPKAGQGRVDFLVEVCDPCQGTAFAYQVNGITVSDFYTPHFFDPLPAANVRYSFSGAIAEPRAVLRDGYLTWHDPVSDDWFQQRFFGDAPELLNLGPLSRQTGRTESLRATVNAMTPEAYEHTRVKGQKARVVRAARSKVDTACAAKAKRLQEEIARLTRKKKP